MSGNLSFDSSRIRYKCLTSPISFEMMRMGDSIEAFINLSRPILEDLVKVELQLGDEVIEEKVPVHEGRMRLKLPSKMRDEIITCLQGGTKVVISLDEGEEVLEPDLFTASYEEFIKTQGFLKNIIQVPL